MSFDQFSNSVNTTEELTSIVGTPSGIALRKELKALDEHMRRFIAHSPFLVISTYSADGLCDTSPRGDPPGSILIVNERTLLIPDRPGNRRVDSLRNIVETGRIGILFLVPGLDETLRVNGRAAIIRDDKWLAALIVEGKQPALAIAVEVEECYLQCAKALLRSKLWDAHARTNLESLPCVAEMLADQVQIPEFDKARMQNLLDESYKERLY